MGLIVVIFVYFFFGKVGIGIFLFVFIFLFFVLVGVILVVVIIYLLVWKDGVLLIWLILVGIVVVVGFGVVSLIFFMKMIFNDFCFVMIWLVGSLWGIDWKFVLSVFLWMVIFLLFVISKVYILNVMNLGDFIVVGFGVNVEKERCKLLFIVVCLVGVFVVVVGGIGFIGLMVLYLVRCFVGGKY